MESKRGNTCNMTLRWSRLGDKVSEFVDGGGRD